MADEQDIASDPVPVRAGRDGAPRADRGYGTLLLPGMFGGLIVGLLLDQPSAGTLIGLGIGALLALLLPPTGRQTGR